MSGKNESEPSEPYLRFEVEGHQVELRRDNSHAYFFEEEPEFDCVRYDEKDGDAVWLFRCIFGDFKTIVDYMNDNEYDVTTVRRARPDLRTLYYSTFGYPEITLRELTASEERQVDFAKYLLDKEMVTVEDFYDER